MKILKVIGKDDLAKVYVAEFDDGKIAEFVESLQPPFLREEKWVILVSSSFGCPIRCMMCDAGGDYNGNLTSSQMFEQIDYCVLNRYPESNVPAKKFKIQFARMGEPSLNVNVLEVLDHLLYRYNAPGLMPCISTTAPLQSGDFFEELLSIKKDKYSGRFQLQFSIHSTDEKERDRLIPIPKWSLPQIAEYGRRFYQRGDRKVTLNFALVQGIPLNAQIMRKTFSPDYFMIKITPINPTCRAIEHNLKSYISPTDTNRQYRVVEELKQQGFDTLISIGENEENLIGSNCGQYVMAFQKSKTKFPNSYTYVD